MMSSRIENLGFKQTVHVGGLKSQLKAPELGSTTVLKGAENLANSSAAEVLSKATGGVAS